MRSSKSLKRMNGQTNDKEPHERSNDKTCRNCAWSSREFTFRERDGKLSQVAYCRRNSWGWEEKLEAGTFILRAAVNLVNLDSMACPAIIEKRKGEQS